METTWDGIKSLLSDVMELKWPVIITAFFFISKKAFEFIEKYLYNDWGFLVILGVAIILDAYFAITTNWKEFEIGIFFKKTFKKITLYGAGLLMGHGFAYLGHEYIQKGLYFLIYFVEADSVCKRAINKSLMTILKKGWELMAKVKEK